MHRARISPFSSRFNPHHLAFSLLMVILLASSACSNTTSPPGGTATSQDIRVVAAENFYGDIATQIGGDRVSVVSILSDPSTDPHEYESNATDAKTVADAQIIIKNNLGYDAFMDKLMSASPRPNRIVIDMSELTGHKEGDNPHVWYEPTTMPKLAQQLTTVLTQLDPAGSDYFAGRLQTFITSMKPVNEQILVIQTKHKGAKVLPTEPIFDYMTDALGLDIVGKEGAFQKAVENGNDPPAAAVGEFRQQISSHTIKALIYNSQAVTPITREMQDLAKQNNVPVVPVFETEPSGKTYQQWMLDELQSLQQALGG